jgi:hypothetical protein
LSAFFFPVLDGHTTTRSASSVLNNGLDYFAAARAHVLYDPRYKIARLLNVPQMPDASKNFSADSWLALEKRLVQLTVSHCSEAQINWSVRPHTGNALRQVGNLYVARGADSHKYDFTELALFERA